MIRNRRILVAFSVLLAVVACGCSSETDTDENDSHSMSRSEHDRQGGEHAREGRGEHARDGEGHREEGEESGTELQLTETYDKVRNGARLILAYDAESSSFKGTVENTTEETLERVRVEVHLSNGKELGPTTPGDLEPGTKREVELVATSTNFDGWTAHPEVGNEEHGGGHSEGREEHGREARGEHDREGSEHAREGTSEHR